VNGLHRNAVEHTLEILAMVEYEIDVIDNPVTKSSSDTRVCIKPDSEVQLMQGGLDELSLA